MAGLLHEPAVFCVANNVGSCDQSTLMMEKKHYRFITVRQCCSCKYLLDIINCLAFWKQTNKYCIFFGASNSFILSYPQYLMGVYRPAGMHAVQERDANTINPKLTSSPRDRVRICVCGPWFNSLYGQRRPALGRRRRRRSIEQRRSVHVHLYISFLLASVHRSSVQFSAS